MRFAKILHAVAFLLVLSAIPLAAAAVEPGGLIATLVDPRPETGAVNGFASAVATLGDRAIISAPFDLVDGIGSGAVYVFDGLNGDQLLRLRNPAPTSRITSFGFSVSALGPDVLVGAPDAGSSVGVPGPGAAYRFSGTTGALLKSYSSPNQIPPLNNGYGRAVIPFAANIIVGEPGYDTPIGPSIQNVGAAHVTDPVSGAIIRTIMRSNPTGLEEVGGSLAVLDGKLLAGAPGNSVAAQNAGAAYLFDIATGAQLHSFTSPNPRRSENFGRTVATVGNAVLIGAPNMGSTGPNYAGAVYMFDASTGGLLHTFLNPFPTPGSYDFFGASLAVIGDQILIGAPADNNVSPRGRAYLFDATGFSLLHTFSQPTGEPSLAFGSSVAGFSNGNYLIGANGDNVTVGAAYVFAAVPEPSSAVLMLVGLGIGLAMALQHGGVVCVFGAKRTLRLTSIALLGFVWPIANGSTVFAEVRYTVTTIGIFPGAGGGSYAYGVSDAGVVVGEASVTDSGATPHAFRFENGVLTDLGTLAGGVGPSIALDINEAGVIVGSSYTTSVITMHAFRYANGVMTDLGTLGGGDSEARAVNENGWIVGRSSLAPSGNHAFLHDGTRMIDLGTLGGQASEANGINDLGQIVGYAGTPSEPQHAFLYENGVMKDLGDFGRGSIANDINNKGQIAGAYVPDGASDDRAFLYQNGVLTDLGTLGSRFSHAKAINERGDIVGHSQLTIGGIGHAFMYTNGQMLDLNTLIDPASGWILTEASDINDSGQVVGYGISRQGTRAFLLTPVPEPTTNLMAVLAGPLLLLAWLRRCGGAGCARTNV